MKGVTHAARNVVHAQRPGVVADQPLVVGRSRRRPGLHFSSPLVEKARGHLNRCPCFLKFQLFQVVIYHKLMRVLLIEDEEKLSRVIKQKRTIFIISYPY